MSLDAAQERQQAHAYLDRLPPAQLSAVCRLLEAMLPDPVSRALANAPLEDEEISEEEDPTAARSREWFKNNQGTSFEKEFREFRDSHHNSAILTFQNRRPIPQNLSRPPATDKPFQRQPDQPIMNSLCFPSAAAAPAGHRFNPSRIAPTVASQCSRSINQSTVDSSSIPKGDSNPSICSAV